MACIKNNASSDLYVRNALYCPEDILCACRAEDDEQKRRIADAEGENHKRVLANNMSVMLGEELRAAWFQHGPSFVLSLLSSMRSAAYNTASAIGTKAGAAAHQISSSVSSQAHAAAHNIKEKSLEKAHSASSLVQEKAHSASSLMQAKAVDLKDKGLETAQGAKSWFSDKTFEYAQWFKDAVTNTTLYKKFGNFTGHSNMTFAMMEEEAERSFRMNSSGEIFAIQNALNVASLIKALHPELYRPCSNPDIYYTTRLLEERERSFRMSSSSEKFAIKNAIKLASIIKELSPALYRPAFEPNSRFAIRLLEERERSFRMNSSSEECAINNALELASIIKDVHPALCRRGSASTLFASRMLEEAERSRRIGGDKVAIDNAKNVCNLVNKKFSLAQAAPKKAEAKGDIELAVEKKARTAAM